MFRKFSKSSLKPAAASQTSAQAPPTQLAWPHKRLQAGLKTASDSNLPSPKEVRSRRATIAAGQPDFTPPVSRQKRPSHAEIQPRKIVSYMPELYDEVDPIRVTGRFYAWDDPSWLDYVPLPPPPRKDANWGRIASKPKRGPGVCSMCTSQKSFSCGSSHCGTPATAKA
ncbi:hypothetical protein K438DRAFT_2025719 [Mycena galopus ATCC 62051]|nr:hypothetical protein K438DRAFT_2025719 [Mycena galopus ATCC 62051]